MLKYHIDQTAVTVELAILSGGYTVTGRTPTCLMRRRYDGFYYDFASKTFTGTTTSATSLLTSAIDGLYKFSWDVSGIFNTSTHMMFEYHDATCLAIEEVWFTRPPLSTSDALGGVGGSVVVGGKGGIWTTNQRDKIIDDVKKIKDSTINFRREAMLILKDLVNKPSITLEDMKAITDIKERDLDMYQDLLKILELRDTSTEKEIFEKLELYIRKEEQDKKKFMEKLNEIIGDVDDEEDDDD